MSCHWRGLSPRERGNRGRLYSRPTYGRSIPARAGEPPSRPSGDGSRAVYPRASGGTVVAITVVHGRQRSIPARAGEPSTFAVDPQTAPISRSIPARAGEPRPPISAWHDRPVNGLSPRERGNRLVSQRRIRPARLHSGSIPARAGEPRARLRQDALHPGLSPREPGLRPNMPPNIKVYPRASGGTNGTHREG